VAGFLHDALDNTNVSRAEIETAFSATVLALVEAVSEWTESLVRKEHAIASRKAPEPDALAIVAADRLDDVRTITETLRHLGEEKTWSVLQQKRSEQHRLYRSFAATLLEEDPGSRLFRTLDYETQAIGVDLTSRSRVLNTRARNVAWVSESTARERLVAAPPPFLHPRSSARPARVNGMCRASGVPSSRQREHAHTSTSKEAPPRGGPGSMRSTSPSRSWLAINSTSPVP